MKRFVWMFSIVIAMASIAHAETYPMGAGVAVKVEYFHFTDSTIRDLNADNGIYVGIEAYKELFLPNLYLGVEAGWAGSSGGVGAEGQTVVANGVGTVVIGLSGNGTRVPGIGATTISNFHLNLDNEISYVPIEFNAKYIIPISPCWNAHLGAGFSYNYFNLETTASFALNGNRLSVSADSSDWVFGGQLFAGVDYKYRNWFAGIGVKYQMTEDFDISLINAPVHTNTSADNLRVGLKMGYMF